MCLNLKCFGRIELKFLNDYNSNRLPPYIEGQIVLQNEGLLLGSGTIAIAFYELSLRECLWMISDKLLKSSLVLCNAECQFKFPSESLCYSGVSLTYRWVDKNVNNVWVDMYK